MKSAQDQVAEIHELVADAQETLDQVCRALRTLDQRIDEQGQAPTPA